MAQTEVFEFNQAADSEAVHYIPKRLVEAFLRYRINGKVVCEKRGDNRIQIVRKITFDKLKNLLRPNRPNAITVIPKLNTDPDAMRERNLLLCYPYKDQMSCPEIAFESPSCVTDDQLKWLMALGPQPLDQQPDERLATWTDQQLGEVIISFFRKYYPDRLTCKV